MLRRYLTALVTLAASGCGSLISDGQCDDGESVANGLLLADVDIPAAQTPDPAAAPVAVPALTPTLRAYESCQAMQDELRAIWRTRRDHDYGYYPYGGMGRIGVGTNNAGSGADPGKCRKMGTKAAAKMDTVASGASAPQESATAGGSDQNDSFTNVQEQGVDEADTVKIGAHHLYVQRGQELVVVARQTLAPLGTLPLPGSAGVTLYADGDTLIVVGRERRASQQLSSPAYGDYDGGHLYADTSVRIFHAAEGALPVLAKEHRFNGNAYDTRYVGSRLLLVFKDTLPWNTYDPTPTAAPIALDGGAVQGIPCERILRPAAADLDARFVKVVTLNAAPGALDEAPQVAAVIGGGDQIYMTPTTLYLTKQGIQWDGRLSAADEASYYETSRLIRQLEGTLVVTKVAFDAATGAVSPVAVGTVDGRVKDQWAFKEHTLADGEKVLSIATTTGHLHAGGEDMAKNHLHVLRQREAHLEVAAAVRDFGLDEDIRSVRYVEHMAYVVTFKKTDPLFAFDLSNPLEPKLLGELKIPGFSVYMHPVAPGRLVGVGFDADDQGDFAWYQGIQISLFDVSNPLAPARLDVEIVGDRGSSSDVTGDHHAFFFDPARSLVGVPVVELGGKGAAAGPAMGSQLRFSGAILYRVEATQLVEAARITHAPLIPAACRADLGYGRWWEEKTRSMDINRLYVVDGKLLSVSRFGLMAHDPDHLDASPQVVGFPAENATDACGYGSYN